MLHCRYIVVWQISYSTTFNLSYRDSSLLLSLLFIFFFDVHCTFCRLRYYLFLESSYRVLRAFFTRPVIIIRVTRANQVIIKPNFTANYELGRINCSESELVSDTEIYGIIYCVPRITVQVLFEWKFIFTTFDIAGPPLYMQKGRNINHYLKVRPLSHCKLQRTVREIFPSKVELGCFATHRFYAKLFAWPISQRGAAKKRALK